MRYLTLALLAAIATARINAAIAELNTATGTIETADGSFAGRDFSVPKDFKLELLYEAPASQGQWVAMTWDNKNRLIVPSYNSDQMFRLTIPKVGSNDKVAIEPIDTTKVGAAEGILYAFNSLYMNVNRSGTVTPGVYRLTDTNGDGKYVQTHVLRNLTATGDHGTHALKLAPDGKSIFMVSGNQTRPTQWQSSRVPQIWGEDNLVPRMTIPGGPGYNRAPSAYIMDFDPEGKNFELFAMGMRNPVSHAFNKDGELFVYDSDMEYDMGDPWYRPTNIQHTISGADLGWRDGSRKHPTYYFDYYGVIATVGSGSPTGSTFGTGASFPARYQDAFYVCDWSYGNLWSVFITPNGASYKAEVMPFVSGRPFAVTGAIVNPADGSLIVQTGGNQATNLYRVTYVGKESTAPSLPDKRFLADRELRQSLEKFHGHADAKAVDAVWPYLSDPDRSIRFAARTALEWQPQTAWKDKALAETDPRKIIATAASLARTNGRDEFFRPPGYQAPDKALQTHMLEALDRVDFDGIAYQDKLDLLRAYGLTFIRLGPPDEATRLKLIAKFDPMLPANQRELNWELGEMLVYLEAPSAATKLMALLRTAPSAPYYANTEFINPELRQRNDRGGGGGASTAANRPGPGGLSGASNQFLAKQEDQVQYAQLLSRLHAGWTLDLRKEYFQWFVTAARDFRGGNTFAQANQIMRIDAVSQIPPDVLPELQDVLNIPIVTGGGGRGGGGAGAGRGGAGGGAAPAAPIANPAAP